MERQMQSTTTFCQFIGNGAEPYWLTVPVGRVEKLLEKLDAANDSHQLRRALKLIQRYISSAPAITVPVVPTVRKEDIKAAVTQSRGQITSDRIAALREQFNMSYANARYYVTKD